MQEVSLLDLGRLSKSEREGKTSLQTTRDLLLYLFQSLLLLGGCLTSYLSASLKLATKENMLTPVARQDSREHRDYHKARLLGPHGVEMIDFQGEPQNILNILLLPFSKVN